MLISAQQDMKGRYRFNKQTNKQNRKKVSALVCFQKVQEKTKLDLLVDELTFFCPPRRVIS